MTDESIEGRSLLWHPTSIEATMHTWREANCAYVQATVIDSGGSTPRLNGTMLVCNSTSFAGTIGGGAIEKRILDECLALLASSDKTKTVNVHLVRDLAMCCGGRMTVFLNKTEARPHLVILGAGHIGGALARLCAETEFAVTVVDERPEWTEVDRFGQHVSCIQEDPVWFISRRELHSPTFYIVVTHSHDLDQRLVEALLKRNEPTAFIGLIGSRGKWARFRQRLEHKGFSEAELARVQCPCGLNIGSETPVEIAVSVLAQLIQHHRVRGPTRTDLSASDRD